LQTRKEDRREVETSLKERKRKKKRRNL